ncbi:uncharacterized protein At4g06744-like [Aristolochia californica]|uniref:uncharacterized protein At4g06744-like n=1 Tax=Aristolochia californica TaxID=171875 RepID=UPI0035E2211D
MSFMVRDMSAILFKLVLLLGCFLVLSASSQDVGGDNSSGGREALEVGIEIGFGGPAIAPPPEECEGCHPPVPDCPPPPPPPPEPSCPPPPQQPPMPLISASLRIAVPVIRRFQKTVTCDPKSTLSTWVGDSPMDVCDRKKYKGFFCEKPPGRNDLTIASIDFNGLGICSSSTDILLDNFVDIALFHANSNNLTGTITPKIANLPYLYELDLSNNKFSSQFPSVVLKIKMLDFLDLRFNQLSGLVPRELFVRPLTVLFINNNQFLQKLPDNLGASPVTYLTLANNRFGGAIPRSIGNAKNTLREVLFLNNQLSGCLPYEIGFLQKATVFDAGGNYLVGPIPISFGCLKKVEQLNLARNMLTGEIPEVVCALPSLLNLSLSDNYFTSVGPVCKKLIEKNVLDVRKNCIPGCPSQRSQQECSKFLCKPVNCPCPPTAPCNLPALEQAVLASPPPLSVPLKASYSALHRP